MNRPERKTDPNEAEALPAMRYRVERRWTERLAMLEALNAQPAASDPEPLEACKNRQRLAVRMAALKYAQALSERKRPRPPKATAPDLNPRDVEDLARTIQREDLAGLLIGPAIRVKVLAWVRGFNPVGPLGTTWPRDSRGACAFKRQVFLERLRKLHAGIHALRLEALRPNADTERWRALDLLQLRVAVLCCAKAKLDGREYAPALRFPNLTPKDWQDGTAGPGLVRWELHGLRLPVGVSQAVYAWHLELTVRGIRGELCRAGPGEKAELIRASLGVLEAKLRGIFENAQEGRAQRNEEAAESPVIEQRAPRRNREAGSCRHTWWPHRDGGSWCPSCGTVTDTPLMIPDPED